MSQVKVNKNFSLTLEYFSFLSQECFREILKCHWR